VPYEDFHERIYATYFADPISYSFIDKGSQYRDRIICEVNETAFLKTKAMGLRDAAGLTLFEEEKNSPVLYGSCVARLPA